MKSKSRRQSPKRKSIRGIEGITIGVDLGDRTSRYCVIEGNGEVVSEGSVATTRIAMREKFGGLGHCRIALEVGPHSLWVSRLACGIGSDAVAFVQETRRRVASAGWFSFEAQGLG